MIHSYLDYAFRQQIKQHLILKKGMMVIYPTNMCGEHTIAGSSMLYVKLMSKYPDTGYSRHWIYSCEEDRQYSYFY